MENKIHSAIRCKLTLFLLLLLTQIGYTQVATYTVTNTMDAGAGSLRQAILDANANVSTTPDVIEFNIPGAGPHTIMPLSKMPEITDPVFIDGLSQPGAACGNWPPTLLIEISNDQIPGNGVLRLTTSGSGSTIQGLVINNSKFAAGINLASSSDNNIYCNFIGTDPSGSQAKPNAGGIDVRDASNNIKIGGLAPGQRNLISGNTQRALDADDSGTIIGPRNVDVVNNFIGTDVSGVKALPNNQGVEADDHATNWSIIQNVISGNEREGLEIDDDASMIYVYGNLIGTDSTGAKALPNTTAVSSTIEAVIIDDSASKVYFGGPGPGQRNIIAGNRQNGFEIANGATEIYVQGNHIGVDINGEPLPNQGLHGISFDGLVNNVKIGGTAPNEGNIIAYHGGTGVILLTNGPNFIPTSIDISGNRIFNNGALGIDITPLDQGNAVPGDGLTANDALDADDGPNGQQNFPVITSAAKSSSFQISGTLNSTPKTTGFRIEFFSNTVCNGDQNGNPQSPNHGEGEFFLGSTMVNTDANGLATFEVSLPFAEGTFITATATDPNGQTSEFSQCFEAELVELPVFTAGDKMVLVGLVLMLSIFVGMKRFFA